MNTTHTKASRLLLLLALLLLGAMTAAAQDGAAKLDEYLSAATKLGRFSGSVLVARDGKVILSKGYGLASAELEVPNTPQTKFRLGSITKQFTATAIMQLQERGKLSVQDPVCKYLSDCPKAWEEITIHHLLTHTSGIPNYTSFAEYRNKMTLPTPLPELLARFKDRPLDFKVGEKYAYSNSGYALLGHVIEQASGKKYEDFLRENIFAPLQMLSTGYDHSDRILKHRAAGYRRNGETLANAPYLDMTIPHAAGALYSTVEDLYLWDQALYTEKVLSRKSLDAMFTPVQSNYGYGWGTASQGARKMISHGGGINGFSTFIARFPEEKATIIVLTNLEGSNPGRVSRDLAAIIFGEPYEVPRERQAIKVEPRILDAYVGEYELAPNVTMTISREGERIMAQVTGQPKIEIFPEAETKFFLKVVEAQLTFIKDERGQVTHLILHQGGEQRAKKIK
jgi:CubicO group peptidase (beta-lactamase class C family)